MRSFRGDVNSRDALGCTALYAAIMCNNVDTVNMLLEWDSVDVEQPVRGLLPIYWAVLAPIDDPRVLRLLHQQRSVAINVPTNAMTGHRCVMLGGSVMLGCAHTRGRGDGIRQRA